MWDNVTRGAFPADKRDLLRKIAWLLVVAVVVFGTLAVVLFPEALNIDGLRRAIKYWNVSDDGETGRYSFDAHNSNCYGMLNNGLAVASVGGLSTYAPDGTEQVVSQAQLALPAMQTGKNIAMAYDVGGTTLLAVRANGGEVLRVTSEKEILDADLSPDGSLCYISSAAGYKSVLVVYNEKQEMVYRWLSSSTYMPVCAIAPKAEAAAVVSLSQSGGSFQSNLELFRTDSEQIAGTVSLGNQLIYDLTYLGDKKLCAVGETDVRFFDEQGNAVGSYGYGGRFLKDYHYGGDGFLTLSLNMYRAGNRYTLVTVDETGAEIASLFIGEEILDLSVCGKYIAVLTNQGLTIYNRNLKIYAETDTVNHATAVLMREDGTALLLGAGKGWLYIP